MFDYLPPSTTSMLWQEVYVYLQWECSQIQRQQAEEEAHEEEEELHRQEEEERREREAAAARKQAEAERKKELVSHIKPHTQAKLIIFE